MSMTPDEAEEKDCPMRFTGDGFQLKCRADRCMAWEWTYSKWDKDKGATIDVEGRCGFVNPSPIIVFQD